MTDDKSRKDTKERVLTAEQETILDMYIRNLDEHFESVKEAEQTEVEIETLHLRRILTK